MRKDYNERYDVKVDIDGGWHVVERGMSVDSDFGPAYGSKSDAVAAMKELLGHGKCRKAKFRRNRKFRDLVDCAYA